MNLEKFQERANKILEKDESMSFKEFGEGVLNYAFNKGFKDYTEEWNETKDDSLLTASLLKSEIEKIFHREYNAFIGDYHILDRVEFVEKRADEFGLELDNEYEIKDFKTTEIEEEFKEIRKNDYDDYYGEFSNGYEFNCSGTIYVEAKKLEREIKDRIDELKHYGEDKDKVLYKEVRAMIDDNYPLENPFFKEKTDFIEEVTKEFMEDRIERIKKGEDIGIGDYDNTQDLVEEFEKLGFDDKAIWSVSFVAMDNYLDNELGLASYERDRYKEQIFNIENKKENQEKNIE